MFSEIAWLLAPFYFCYRLIRLLVIWVYRTFIAPPPFDQHEAYKDSLKWVQEFKPAESCEGYDKALTFAWKKFESISAASDTLDKKADNLMRNAGIVAGLLGLALNTLKLESPDLLVPSLIAFVVSLALAAIACNPTAGATTASIQDVLDDMGDGHHSDAWIAASLHCATVGRVVLNEWKATRIRWATYAFCLGLAMFVLPLYSLYRPSGRKADRPIKPVTVIHRDSCL